MNIDPSIMPYHYIDSPNWVVFQPNIIIDVKLGCLWYIYLTTILYLELFLYFTLFFLFFNNIGTLNSDWEL